MATLAELVVNLTANASGFNKTFDDAKEKSAGLGSHISNTMGNIGKAMAGVAIGGGIALVGFLANAVSEAAEAEAGLAQLEAVIKSTGGAAGVTSGELTSLASELQKTTKFSDDQIIAGESMLLTFTNIGKDVFPAATKTILDMSQALGQDLKSSSMQLGKALNDPIAGIGALSRVGVTFTESQKEMIKAMVAAGDVAGAQKVILAELGKEFGGSAEAAGKTFSGQLAIAKNMLGEFGETVGGAILPLLTPLIGRFIEFATAALPQVQAALTVIIPLIADGLGSAINFAVENIPKILAVIQQVFTDIQPAIQVAITFITGTLIPTITTVVGFVVDNFPKIQAAVKGVFDFLAANVFPVAEMEINGLMSVIKVVVDWVVANWPLIQATVERVMLAISNVIQVVLPIIRTIFETVFPIVVGVVKLAMSTILDVIKVIMQLITGDTEGALTTLKGIFDRIWNAILGVIRDVGRLIFEAVKKPIQDAIDWINGIDNTLRQIGVNIINGIVNGIRSAPGAIRDALSGIVNGAIDSIRNTLGIHSPSTVFAAIGGNMMSGLAAGIKGAGDLPTVQLNGVVKGVTGAAMSSGRATSGMGNTATITMNFYGAQDTASVRDGTMQGLRAAGLIVRPA